MILNIWEIKEKLVLKKKKCMNKEEEINHLNKKLQDWVSQQNRDYNTFHYHCSTIITVEQDEN